MEAGRVEVLIDREQRGSCHAGRQFPIKQVPEMGTGRLNYVHWKKSRFCIILDQTVKIANMLVKYCSDCCAKNPYKQPINFGMYNLVMICNELSKKFYFWSLSELHVV